jgi:hypothetical protein
LGATERDEAARTAYRESIKQLDANKIVVVDECGSNIALTPLYARARDPGNGPMAAFPATVEKT